MKFITALSTNRIERQQQCIDSWLPHAIEVVAVNHPDDIPSLAEQFTGVRFVENTGPSPLYPHLPRRTKIADLFSHGPGLLINADIQVASTEEQFKQDWCPEPGVLKVGVRYDHWTATGRGKMQLWGIDAFLVTYEAMRLFSDPGFVIGVPTWDFWMVWEAMLHKMEVRAKTTRGLKHLNHDGRWGELEYEIGHSVMWDCYRVEEKTLAAAVKAATGR